MDGETPVRGAPRVALIGYGAIAEMHVAALGRAGVRPVVVAGPKSDEVEAFAERHAIGESTTDVSRAIAHPDVEAVVLASPSDVHADQAREALEADRHVLVEIPLALSYGEGEGLVQEAADRGRTLMVCHTLRYWAPHARLHEWLRDGGHEVHHVVARALSLRLEDVGWTGRRRSWTDDVLWHHGGHVIDEVVRLLGRPVTGVSAAVGPVWPLSGRSMDYAISLRTADGAVATVALSYNARIGASDYLVMTDRETALMQGADVTSSAGPLVEGLDPAAAQVEAVAAQDRDFLESVASGGVPLASAADILPVLAIQQQVADRLR